MMIWNPWHGCHKISPGCANCYVYRRDESIRKDYFGLYPVESNENARKTEKELLEGKTEFSG